jgi:hypothetical protein
MILGRAPVPDSRDVDYLEKKFLRQTERIFHLGSDGGSISIVDKLANQQ